MFDNAGKKILVIDDDVYIRDSIIGFLEDYDFKVIEAENGQVGLELLDRRELPDLILCGLRMPVVDGLEVLSKVSEQYANIPVIIVSGASNISDTVNALRLGAWDYIIKPVQDMTVLLHAVNKAVERKTLIQEKEKYQKDLERTNTALQVSLDTLRDTRDRLVQSEKMAALGELVAGVAHEINTPVGVGVTAASFLNGKTQIFFKSYKDGQLKRSELESFLKMAKEVSNSILINMQRAAELISSFKQVAVDQSSQHMRRFNFKEYIDEVLLSLRPKYKKTSHTIQVDCPDDISINSYPGAFSQVLSNLINNSLLHGFKERERGVMDLRARFGNNALTFIYSDNGMGMNEEQKEKMFDPFFTTMRGKGGAGLGMSILFNLVTHTLKGKIDMETAPGKGVKFTIIFPDLTEEG